MQGKDPYPTMNQNLNVPFIKVATFHTSASMKPSCHASHTAILLLAHDSTLPLHYHNFLLPRLLNGTS